MNKLIIIFFILVFCSSCKENTTGNPKLDDKEIILNNIEPGLYSNPENLGTFSGKFLKAGDFAPDYLLNKGTESEFSLSDIRGKVVYIKFWRSRCSSCRSSIPVLVSKYNSLNDTNFVVITVTSDQSERVSIETVSTFIEDFDMNKWINIYDGMDNTNSIFANYNIFGTPNGFIIDKTGKIVQQISPKSSDFEKIVQSELSR